MTSKIDALLHRYTQVIREPWEVTLSGQERVWFLVYPPQEDRKMMLRKADFEQHTLQAGKAWLEISLRNAFPTWMSQHEYQEAYFEQPEDLADQLAISFQPFLIDWIKERISRNDGDTVVALVDLPAIFGLAKLSDVLNQLYHDIRGRYLIFFPGEFVNNQYRFMDARDGWSYLARPITT